MVLETAAECPRKCTFTDPVPFTHKSTASFHFRKKKWEKVVSVGTLWLQGKQRTLICHTFIWKQFWRWKSFIWKQPKGCPSYGVYLKSHSAATVQISLWSAFHGQDIPHLALPRLGRLFIKYLERYKQGNEARVPPTHPICKTHPMLFMLLIHLPFVNSVVFHSLQYRQPISQHPLKAFLQPSALCTLLPTACPSLSPRLILSLLTPFLCRRSLTSVKLTTGEKGARRPPLFLQD